VHLFGKGDGGSGCFLSERQQQHVNYGFLRRLLDLGPGDVLDERYVERLLQQLSGSSLQAVLLLAQDGRYDHRGELDRDHTDCFVPNDWLFTVCARAPRQLLPCCSINPRRRDALAELERCHARGARACKVHPPTMEVDPAEPRFRPFWRRLAELDVLLMVHTGTEHAAPVVGFEVCDPERLEPALQEGCTVVAAHSGFGSFQDGVDQFASLQRLVAQYPRLYCDTAVLGSMFRWRNLPALLADPLVLARAVHASDWPFPSNALVHWQHLRPSAMASLLSERNLLERDLRLEQALGFPAEFFQRGARLLGLA